MREDGDFPDGKYSPEASKFAIWFAENKKLALYGGGAILLVVIIILYFCFRKKPEPDPYLTKTYSKMDPEAIQVRNEYQGIKTIQ